MASHCELLVFPTSQAVNLFIANPPPFSNIATTKFVPFLSLLILCNQSALHLFANHDNGLLACRSSTVFNSINIGGLYFCISEHFDMVLREYQSMDMVFHTH